MAKEKTLLRTHSEIAPWRIIQGDDKRRARLNMMRDLLGRVPHEPTEIEPVTLPRRVFNADYERHNDIFRHLAVPSYYE